MNIIQCTVISLLVFSSSLRAAEEKNTKTSSAVDAIRAETLRKNLDPEGRPLPLAAHWNRLEVPVSYQIELINKGHHILPWLAMIMPDRDGPPPKKPTEPTYTADLKQLAELKLPFAFITGGQWEQDLVESKLPWRDLPPEKNPAVWLAQPTTGKDGKERLTEKRISPLGAVEPWREVGKRWIETSGMRKAAEIYPNPDFVMIVSNNEAGKLKWSDIEREKRFVDQYAKPGSQPVSDEEKRKIVGDGWIERYSAMISSMRSSLPNDAWKKNTLFVAYQGAGCVGFGRPETLTDKEHWTKYSLITSDRIDPLPSFWEGSSTEFYDNHWQDPQGKALFNAWSCQIEAMNLVFQMKEVFRNNPNFWFETIFWDGDMTNEPKEAAKGKYKIYADINLPDSPERYLGWTQYCMWTLTPRVAREWRSSNDKRDRWWDHFAQIINAVDKVHIDPVLTKFWRKGELVPNRAHEHIFNADVPAKWKTVDRWFNLDTNIDPPRPWALTTRLPIFSLARVMGQAPNREWLVYGHAPMGDKKKVEITIPEYKNVTVDVSIAGSFYHVKETDGSVTEVGKKI